MAWLYARATMSKPLVIAAAAALLACGFSASPVLSQSHDEQQQARKDMRNGNILPVREIERLILPQMKGHEYLGPSYDPAAMAYRLKFIRDGKVLFVDVDARTGKIIARSR